MPLASTFDSNFTCCHCQQYFVFGAEILQSYCRTDTMRITRYVRKFQTFVLKAAIIELQQYKNFFLPCQMVIGQISFSFSFTFTFSISYQSIESVIGMSCDGSRMVVLLVPSIGISRHGQKMFSVKVGRFDVMLTMNAAWGMRPGGGGGFHPVLRTRGLSIGPLQNKTNWLMRS